MATDRPCTPPRRLPPASRVLVPRRTPWHPQVGSQLAAQIGLGLPAFSSAADGGYISPPIINDALDCLAA